MRACAFQAIVVLVYQPAGRPLELGNSSTCSASCKVSDSTAPDIVLLRSAEYDYEGALNAWDSNHFQEALQLFRLSAQKGYGLSELCWRWGRYHELPPQDLTQAMRWYQRGARMMHANSITSIGKLHLMQKQEEEARVWLLRTARPEAEGGAVGDPLAQWFLAELELKGGRLRQAVRWWKRSAEGGDPDAMMRLHVIFDTGGLGVPREPLRSSYWLFSAAARGHQEALMKLMQMQAMLLAEEGNPLVTRGKSEDEDRPITGTIKGLPKFQAFKRWKAITLVSALNKDRFWEPGEIEGIWRRYVMRHHPHDAKQPSGGKPSKYKWQDKANETMIDTKLENPSWGLREIVWPEGWFPQIGRDDKRPPVEWPKEWLDTGISSADSSSRAAEDDDQKWSGSRAAQDDQKRWNRKAKEVRTAFLHAWKGYCRYAWGMDELKPVSMTGSNRFGGSSLSILDSLSSLWLLDLPKEFEKATQFVESQLVFGTEDANSSVFELTIRGLGGLLGAHALSGRPVFLKRANELATKLFPAFNTSSGLPLAQWNLKRNTGVIGTQPTVLAEAGSIQLEWRYLSDQTGDYRYRDAADFAFEAIQTAASSGILPVYLTPPSYYPPQLVASKFAVGGLIDSYYEYLLKQWLQSSGSEPNFKKLFLSTMSEITALVRPRPTKTGFKRYRIVEVDPSAKTVWKMEHLSCFVPGMIALGLISLPAEDVAPHRDEWTALAEGITASCVEMWTSTATGLAPEHILLRSEAPHARRGVPQAARFSFLRPETVESLFYMYRLTKDQKYREWGEQIFDAIVQHSKTEAGYSSVGDVNEIPTEKIDEMHSFVLAETFKYLYLLFMPPEHLDLNKFVLNTEGHPLHRLSRMTCHRELAQFFSWASGPLCFVAGLLGYQEADIRSLVTKIKVIRRQVVVTHGIGYNFSLSGMLCLLTIGMIRRIPDYQESRQRRRRELYEE